MRAPCCPDGPQATLNWRGHRSSSATCLSSSECTCRWPSGQVVEQAGMSWRLARGGGSVAGIGSGAISAQRFCCGASETLACHHNTRCCPLQPPGPHGSRSPRTIYQSPGPGTQQASRCPVAEQNSPGVLCTLRRGGWASLLLAARHGSVQVTTPAGVAIRWHPGPTLPR